MKFKQYVIERYDYEAGTWNEIGTIRRTVTDINDVVKTVIAVCQGTGMTGRVTGVDYDNVCHTIKQMDWREESPADAEPPEEEEPEVICPVCHMNSLEPDESHCGCY